MSNAPPPSPPGTRPADPGAAPSLFFVARQPILDAQRRVFGYELLYRGGPGAVACDADLDQASARVLTDVIREGLDVLTGGRYAFLNAPRRIVMEQLVTALSPDGVVIELLETIEPDAEILEACRELRRRGYRLALDDFAWNERYRDLMALAEFVKVDLLATTPAERRDIIARAAPYQIRLVAEKVETDDAFREAREAGFTYFQGFFFSRPVIVESRAIPASALRRVLLLGALNDPSLGAGQLAGLIKRDVALSFDLLRSINSAAHGVRSPVHSIQEAVVLLGREPIRRWASVCLLAGIAGSGNPEAVSMSLVRARWCELLGAHLWGGEAAAELFLCGMISMLDAILGRSIEDIVAKLPVSPAVRDALCGFPSPWTSLLASVAAYERGEWDAALAEAAAIHLDPALLSSTHREALRWERETEGDLRLTHEAAGPSLWLTRELSGPV